MQHRASYVTQSFACTDFVTQSFAACSKQGSGFFPSRCYVAQSFACPDCATQSFSACSKPGSGFFPSRCYVAQSFTCPDCVTQSFPLSRLCSTELPLSRLCGTELRFGIEIPLIYATAECQNLRIRLVPNSWIVCFELWHRAGVCGTELRFGSLCNLGLSKKLRFSLHRHKT